MSFSTVLEVAIGLSLIYFVLASTVSAAQEVIASWFSWRGTYLVRFIDLLIINQDGAVFGFESVSGWVRAHFTTGAFQASVPVAATATHQTMVEQLRNHPLLHISIQNLPSYISSQNFSTALLHVLAGQSELNFENVKAGIGGLDDGYFKTTLFALVGVSESRVDKFQGRIESWFDESMNRVSGVYRRYTQAITLLLGLALTLVLNIDTLRVGKFLMFNDAIRNRLFQDASIAKADGYNATVGQLEQFNLPIGRSLWWPIDWHRVISSHTAGLLVTAVAISLGAPFWFNLMQNFVRAAGPKPKTNDSGSN